MNNATNTSKTYAVQCLADGGRLWVSVRAASPEMALEHGRKAARDLGCDPETIRAWPAGTGNGLGTPLAEASY